MAYISLNTCWMKHTPTQYHDLEGVRQDDAPKEETLEHAVSDLPKLRQALLDAGWDVARAGAMEQADARVTFH